MNIDLLRAELNEAAAHTGDLGHPSPTPMPETGRPWALFGSTVLLLHGIREQVGDVDVFVTHSIWEYLARRVAWSVHLPDPDDPPYLERHVGGYKVHAFYAWTLKDPEVDALQCRRAAELVHGWWCTPLDLIRVHKAMARKHGDNPRMAKHHRDVEAIDLHIARLYARAA